MAWNCQTEPEFQEQLDWTARFVREEIWPIEPIAYAPNAFGCQAPDSGNSEIRGDGERLPGGTHWRDRPLDRLRHHPNRSAALTLAATGNHESSPPHLARNEEENG